MLAYYSNINLKEVYLKNIRKYFFLYITNMYLYEAIKNRPLGSFKDDFGVPSKFEKSFLVC